jgi:cysteine desulfurase/selenocysteine lyase
VISFGVEGIHPYDIGTLLDKQGIAVRTGHHCTEPLVEPLWRFSGSVRASFADLHNNRMKLICLFQH